MKLGKLVGASLIWIFFVMIGMATSQEIPPSLKILHNYLTSECGYEYNNIGPSDVLTYTKWRSMVTVGFDKDGVRSGTVLFMPGCNTEKAANALAEIYLILQIRMGKQLPSTQNAILKGRRLMDTVVHNLKLMDKTTFPFDDLIVIARTYPKDNSISIRLMPW